MIKKIFTAVLLTMSSHYAFAIIIIPLPNLALPPVISKIRDALEKSSDTKAMATVGEDKYFGARQWAWGYVSGKMTQVDADEQALKKCEATLANAKAQVVGGQPLYNFGNKRCELYKFQNVTLNLPDAVPNSPTPLLTAPVVNQEKPSYTLTDPVKLDSPTTPPSPAQSSSSTLSSNISPTPVDANKSGTSIIQKMNDLDNLLKQGLINQEDYNRKKKQFLDEM